MAILIGNGAEILPLEKGRKYPACSPGSEQIQHLNRLSIMIFIVMVMIRERLTERLSSVWFSGFYRLIQERSTMLSVIKRGM